MKQFQVKGLSTHKTPSEERLHCNFLEQIVKKRESRELLLGIPHQAHFRLK